MRYMFLRPMASEVDDHTNRPSMLVSDSSATKPAAGAGLTLKNSTIIGDAFSRMPMPAVTLRHNTSHSSQNCGVLMALRAETLLVVISLCTVACDWSQPAGFQPSAGTRTRNTPMDMKSAYTTPCTAKVAAMPEVVVPKPASMAVDQGDAINAPPPKPMIAIPVAMPGRSGNHLISVDTGEM